MTSVRKFSIKYWGTLVGLFFITFFAVLVLAGCNTIPVAFPGEFAQAAQQISTSTMDQAIWKEILARLNGQVIEPGYEVYAQVRYTAGGKLIGASGQVVLEATGKGSGKLSDEARAAIIELTKDKPGLADALIKKIEAMNTSPENTVVPVENELNEKYKESP